MSTSAVPLDRAAAATSVGLLSATTAVWVGFVRYEPPMGLLGFLLGWTLMMAAMMLPSIQARSLRVREALSRRAARLRLLGQVRRRRSVRVLRRA